MSRDFPQTTNAATSGVFQLEETGNDDFDMDFSDDVEIDRF